MRRTESVLEHIFKAGAALQAALQVRDDYTQGHCERVAQITALTGARFNLSEEEIQNLQTAAIFHDIGKIGIPDSILLKEGNFTADEYEVMKNHSAIGESVVQKLDIPNARAIADIVRGHHEHIDGSGYPDGLSGSDIPLSARIITAIDVYDALRTRRCYRDALEQDKVFEKMESLVGTVIDPQVYEVVVEVIRELNNSTERAEE